MSEDIAFDSFFISNDKAAADDFAAQTWQPKKAAEAGGAAVSHFNSFPSITIRSFIKPIFDRLFNCSL